MQVNKKKLKKNLGPTTLAKKPKKKVVVAKKRNPIPRILKPVVYLDGTYLSNSIGYSYSGPRMMFLSKPVETTAKPSDAPKFVVHSKDPVTCREDLGRIMRRAVSPDDKANGIDTDVFRLAMCFYKAQDNGVEHEESGVGFLDRRMKNGVRLLNFLSDHIAGWGEVKAYHLPIYKDKKQVAPGDKRLYMIVGPRQWLRSTHYISLACLALRISNVGDLSRYSDESSLITRLRLLTYQDFNQVPEYRRSVALSDAGHIQTTYKFWPLILRHQDEILGTDSLHRAYSESRLSNGDGGYGEGIKRLATCQSSDVFSNNKMKELKEKALKGELSE